MNRKKIGAISAGKSHVEYVWTKKGIIHRVRVLTSLRAPGGAVSITTYDIVGDAVQGRRHDMCGRIHIVLPPEKHDAGDAEDQGREDHPVLNSKRVICVALE